ncbi:TadE/TadG family type IV pilus assembly protein [Arthrobacter sp. SAFR-014]|uniref:TadE/TadG family type IV pilus assembly protein n=1 Tax=unclassified Arthrobacter TaxID=235627 RepID=UPI003F7C6B1B
MSRASEGGAVAVEFALLAPVLIMLLLGIMEFGRAYNAQILLTSAAREGVRVMAITNDSALASAAAIRLEPAVADGSVNFSASSPAGATKCSAGAQISVTVSYPLQTMTGIAGPFVMTGKGTMLCGG